MDEISDAVRSETEAGKSRRGDHRRGYDPHRRGYRRRGGGRHRFRQLPHDVNEFNKNLERLAGEIADNAPIGLELAKESINRGLNEQARLDF